MKEMKNLLCSQELVNGADNKGYFVKIQLVGPFLFVIFTTLGDRKLT